MSGETSFKPFRLENSGGRFRGYTLHQKRGASLCGVVGHFVSGFASGFVSVARAVGAEVVSPIWVEEGGFEVIVTRPMRALGVAVPVRADDEFVAAVYRVVHRNGLRLYLGRPN